MRLMIVAVGRLKSGPERDLAQRYAQRIEAGGRALGVTGLDIREMDESGLRRADERRASEAVAISAAAGQRPMMLLDERGSDLTSEEFAAGLRRDLDSGLAPAFVIGGPDGLDAALISRAARRIRFGAMTMPHQLVRVLLLEQIYRATTILAGHPYHRGAEHRT
jgi:23S rRNA (pseudouridine1915-N3)-methyltransferase